MMPRLPFSSGSANRSSGHVRSGSLARAGGLTRDGPGLGAEAWEHMKLGLGQDNSSTAQPVARHCTRRRRVAGPCCTVKGVPSSS